MGIASIIGGLLKPVTELIDVVYDSPTEKVAARGKIMAIQASVLAQVIEFESELIQAKSSIIVAEAKSESTLTRIWRPTVMLTLTGIIVAAQIGGTPIPPEMWGLLKLGIGGYVVGRSVEKIAPKVVDILKR